MAILHCQVKMAPAEKENIRMSYKKSSRWGVARRAKGGFLPYRTFLGAAFADTPSSIICKDQHPKVIDFFIIFGLREVFMDPS